LADDRGAAAAGGDPAAAGPTGTEALAAPAALGRGGMRRDVVRTTLHPRLQGLGIGQATVFDVNHPVHRPPAEVEGADVRLRDEQRSDGERTVPVRAIAWAAGVEGLVEV
jgi:hypothetical protein